MNERMRGPNRRDVLKALFGAAIAAAAPDAKAEASPLNATEFVELSPEVIRQAVEMIKRHRSESMPPEWVSLVAHLQTLPLNRKIYEAFIALKGKARYTISETYQTPAEMLATGLGDCKDMAFAQYFLLKEVGVDSEVIIAYLKKSRQLHAYTQARRQDGEYMVLDGFRLQSPVERSKAEDDYIDLMHLSRDIDANDDVSLVNTK